MVEPGWSRFSQRRRGKADALWDAKPEENWEDSGPSGPLHQAFAEGGAERRLSAPDESYAHITLTKEEQEATNNSHRVSAKWLSPSVPLFLGTGRVATTQLAGLISRLPH